VNAATLDALPGDARADLAAVQQADREARRQARAVIEVLGRDGIRRARAAH
jgi:hypothetical protein